MKKLAPIIPLFFSLCAPLLAEEAKTNSPPPIIQASEAKGHIGINAVVAGKIVEVNKAAKIVHLNFEKPFPKQPFEAVVFGRSTNQFPDLDQLKGKNVEVSGKITDYQGRAQIVLESTNQLKVVEKTAEPAAAEKK
jgi:DNA/RNA endonuclease YhcR with UshA esterase domain